tara:strand:+ start:152 stop:364 length:213 start_codon:yes stop_codon:yes gene_type:complete
MSDDKKKTKADLEKELEETTTQLQQVSGAYQQLLVANQNLNLLVSKYEETINLLTARVLEARQSAQQQQG